MPSFEMVREWDRMKGDLALTAYLEAPEPQKTYIGCLDQILGGGMMRGVTVIGGPSSSGKSIIGCQATAYMAAMGTKVVYASYEMPWDVVQLRMASAWSHTTQAKNLGIKPFSWSYVATGKAKAESVHAGKDHYTLSRIISERPDPIAHALSMWDEGPGRNVAVLTSGNSVSMLCGMCENISDAPSMALVIDYIQIVPTDRADQKEYERVTEVMNTLQQHALDANGCPVLAISSCRNLKPTDYQDGPSMDWLRGSGYIQYDAEQIVMLVPDKEKDEAGHFVTARDTDGSMFSKLTVLKNRTGETDKSIAVRVYGQYSYIR